jgi:hypothetical protein
MPDPAIEAARDVVEESLDALERAIADPPPELVNWRPAGEGTNPLAVIAVHAVTSTRWWLSVALTGDPPERDRPAEFRTVVADATELRSLVDPLIADCRELLATDDAYDPGAVRTDPRSGAGSEGSVTAAWALLHAAEHLREHVAHAELTRQVWEHAQAPA